FMLMSDGSVRNAFTLKLRNMQHRDRKLEIALVGLEGAVMWSEDMPREAAARTIVRDVAADQTDTMRAYVVAPRHTRAQEFSFRLSSPGEPDETDIGSAQFSAPGGHHGEDE